MLITHTDDGWRYLGTPVNHEDTNLTEPDTMEDTCSIDGTLHGFLVQIKSRVYGSITASFPLSRYGDSARDPKGCADKAYDAAKKLAKAYGLQ